MIGDQTLTGRVVWTGDEGRWEQTFPRLAIIRWFSFIHHHATHLPMTPAQLLAYLGPATIYAGIAALIVFGLLRLLGREVDRRYLLTLYLVFFFLTLTQYPFPDRDLLDCSDGGPQPILRPFATLDHVFQLLERSRDNPEIGIRVWFGNKVIQAAAMNFFLCAAIGAALAQHVEGRRPWLWALVLAVLLSGGAEVTQLTGIFGLYPCAYRQFDVDDIIFNVSGLLFGFTLAFRLSARRR